MAFKLKKPNAFDVFNVILFSILCVLMLYPLWSVFMTSMITPAENAQRAFILWPHEIVWSSYTFVFATDRFPRSFAVTTFVTLASTLFQLVITTTCAYALTKETVPGYKIIMALLVATMFFSGGLIPWFLMIRAMGMNNTLWPLIIGSMGFINFAIVRAFIKQIPEGLEESALIDGASELRIFFAIILPLSKPVIAVIALWVAVGAWNSFFGALLFLTARPDLHTLQLLLRQMIVDQTAGTGLGPGAEMVYRIRFGHDAVIFPEGIRSAAIIVVTVPLLLIFPFLQKYFVRGIYLGSMKG